MTKQLLGCAVAVIIFFSCKNNTPTTVVAQNSLAKKENFVAYQGSIVIDGAEADSVWQRSQWLPLAQRWLGAAYTPDDFEGRYKVAWSPDYLYILAEITDDTLTDTHADGLEKYWDDDCLEIFVDENQSGGNHQYNYNAFAYHLSLDGRAVDIGRDSLKHYFDAHTVSKRTQRGNISTWEVAVALYDDTFDDKKTTNTPVKIVEGKKIGFALAYCDNDRSPERENFIGNVAVIGDDKNRGWIDAGIFGALEMKK